MKHCDACGTDYTDDINFCIKCGSRLVDKPAEPVTDLDPESDPKPKPAPKASGKTGRIIKRIVLAVAAVVIVLILWGTHLMNSTTYLTLNSAGEIFAKRGGESEINIDYDGYVWEVSYKPSWVDIREYDNSFSIECEPNTTGEDREDHITIKSGKIIETLPIGQYGKVRYLNLSESSLTSDTDGGSIHIDIESDGNDANISYPKFCEIEDFTSDGFTLVVKRNDGYSRTGTLQVKEDDASASIYIKQQGKCSDCDGHGSRTCPSCGGLGTTGWGMYTMQCYTCGGTGTIKCYSCNGTGIR